MSTFRNPVGPQPSRVYWRRRLIVGLGLLAVIVIVILIVVRPGSGAPTPAPTPGATNSSPAPVSTNAADAKPCDLKKVTLDPITDSADYDPGANPVLSFALKSLNAVPCTVPAGSDVQEYKITSGDELIWDSKDCQTGQVAAEVLLLPGVPKQGPTLTWDRTRSSTDTCNSDRPQVDAGGASYHLEVIVGDLKSTTTRQFLLNG